MYIDAYHNISHRTVARVAESPIWMSYHSIPSNATP